MASEYCLSKSSRVRSHTRWIGARSTGTLQRGQTFTETLVDLNFKVPADFRQHFKQLALNARLKNIQLLNRAVEAYEREQGREENGR